MTNIPYCCLPQESGPCLSASVGDRPLRSPTHRRLGGPSPRLPSNGTHARPDPRTRRFHRSGMPPIGSWRITRRFHRLTAGTGWVAYALRTRPPLPPAPKDRISFDLHVLGLPLAFILSQDQTLRCNIVSLRSYLLLQKRLPAAPRPPGSLRRNGRQAPFSLPDSPHGRRLAVLAPDSQRTPANGNIQPLNIPTRPVSGCKNTNFIPTNNDFSQKNSKKQHKSLKHNKKKIIRNKKQRNTYTYINIYSNYQQGKKASSICSIIGLPPLKTIEMMSKRVLKSKLFRKI